jgi:hypothetical protein
MPTLSGVFRAPLLDDEQRARVRRLDHLCGEHPRISVSPQLLSVSMVPPARSPRPSRTRLPAAKDIREKPVRVTVDLNPDEYDAFRDWAHGARMTHAAVLRQLVRLLTTDDRVSTLVEAAA